MTVILALDPATHTGYAIGDGTRRASGTWDLSKGVGNHPGSQLLRFAELLEWAIIDNHPNLIAYEQASFGSHNPNIQSLHNEKSGIIKLVACQYEIRVKGLHIMQIKKFVTGNGHAKKDQMIRAARTILGLTTESDDEADACSVLALALYEEARPPELKLTKNAKRRSAAKKTTPRLF